MSNVEPPEDSEYGFVVAQIIRRVSDGVDEDSYPDAISAKGYFTFVPREELVKTTTPPIFEIRESLRYPLDAQGRLSGISEGASVGVWLLVGEYTVVPEVQDARMRRINVVVTTDHTAQNPLDLAELF